MASPSLLSLTRYGREPASTPGYGRTYLLPSISRRQTLDSCASVRPLESRCEGNNLRINSCATGCLEAIGRDFLEPSSCISVPYPSPPQSPLSTARSEHLTNTEHCPDHFRTPSSGICTSLASRDKSEELSRRYRRGNAETPALVQKATASGGSPRTSLTGSTSSCRSAALSFPSPRTTQPTELSVPDVNDIFQALRHEFSRHETDATYCRQTALHQAAKLRHQNDGKEKKVEALEILVNTLRKARDREVAETRALDRQADEILEALAHVKHLIIPLSTRTEPTMA